MNPLMQKRPGAGRVDGPYSFTIEVGPITYYNMTKAEVAHEVRRMRDELDRFARTLMAVGPYSKLVGTTVNKP